MHSVKLGLVAAMLVGSVSMALATPMGGGYPGQNGRGNNGSNGGTSVKQTTDIIAGNHNGNGNGNGNGNFNGGNGNGNGNFNGGNGGNGNGNGNSSSGKDQHKPHGRP